MEKISSFLIVVAMILSFSVCALFLYGGYAGASAVSVMKMANIASVFMYATVVVGIAYFFRNGGNIKPLKIVSVGAIAYGLFFFILVCGFERIGAGKSAMAQVMNLNPIMAGAIKSAALKIVICGVFGLAIVFISAALFCWKRVESLVEVWGGMLGNMLIGAMLFYAAFWLGGKSAIIFVPHDLVPVYGCIALACLLTILVTILLLLKSRIYKSYKAVTNAVVEAQNRTDYSIGDRMKKGINYFLTGIFLFISLALVLGVLLFFVCWLKGRIAAFPLLSADIWLTCGVFAIFSVVITIIVACSTNGREEVYEPDTEEDINKETDAAELGWKEGVILLSSFLTIVSSFIFFLSFLLGGYTVFTVICDLSMASVAAVSLLVAVVSASVSVSNLTFPSRAGMVASMLFLLPLLVGNLSNGYGGMAEEMYETLAFTLKSGLLVSCLWAAIDAFGIMATKKELSWVKYVVGVFAAGMFIFFGLWFGGSYFILPFSKTICNIFLGAEAVCVAVLMLPQNKLR